MSTRTIHVDRRAVRPRRTHIVALLLATLWSGTLLADRIELKTGEVFFGEILRVNRREVSMVLESGGILSFRRSQIAVFRKNFAPSDVWNPTPDLPVGSAPDPDEPVGTSPGEKDANDRFSLKTTDNPDQKLVGALVNDTKHGFRLAVPRGLLDWENPDHSSVLKTFYDPVTRAQLDIVDLDATGRPAESIEAIKKRTLQACSTSVSGLTVVRDEKVEEVPYEAWFVEFTGEAEGTAIRRFLLFGRAGQRSLLLRFSGPEVRFHEFKQAFIESLRSFNFVGVTPGDLPPGASTPPQETPDDPGAGNVDRARELLRLLKSQGQASEETVEEYLEDK